MRPGGEKRGNNRDRKRRKLWMLATFDPELGPDEARCRLVLSDRCLGLLDYATVTADRIDMGGSYTRDNVQPACHNCQRRQGGLAAIRGMADLLTNYRAARDQWETAAAHGARRTTPSTSIATGPISRRPPRRSRREAA